MLRREIGEVGGGFVEFGSMVFCGLLWLMADAKGPVEKPWPF
jgi:hypothetical protein